MENNPYKIRFDILAMAKDLLMEEWNAKRSAMDMHYHQQVSYQDRIGGHVIVPYPEIPPVPDVDGITKLANELNAFVSKKG